VDFRFQEKMRGVVEYMQYREMPSEIKRKVPLSAALICVPFAQPQLFRGKACCSWIFLFGVGDEIQRSRIQGGSKHLTQPSIARVERQIRSYFNLCWRKSPVPFDELRILGDVHRPLRAQILSHVGTLVRSELPILQV
jgi:hypothetical protein